VGGYIEGVMGMWSRSLEVNNRLRGDILEPSQAERESLV
jgi:hypothetical protein